MFLLSYIINKPLCSFLFTGDLNDDERIDDAILTGRIYSEAYLRTEKIFRCCTKADDKANICQFTEH